MWWTGISKRREKGTQAGCCDGGYDVVCIYVVVWIYVFFSTTAQGPFFFQGCIGAHHGLRAHYRVGVCCSGTHRASRALVFASTISAVAPHLGMWVCTSFCHCDELLCLPRLDVFLTSWTSGTTGHRGNPSEHGLESMSPITCIFDHDDFWFSPETRT